MLRKNIWPILIHRMYALLFWKMYFLLTTEKRDRQDSGLKSISYLLDSGHEKKILNTPVTNLWFGDLIEVTVVDMDA